MYSPVTVKKIGNDEVRIVEGVQKVWSWRGNAALILSIIGGIISGGLSSVAIHGASSETAVIEGYPLMLMLTVMYIVLVYFALEDRLYDHNPVYDVYLLSDVSTSTTIPNLGSSTDISAICKAIEKYEKIARDRENDNVRLLEIVERCK